MKTYAAAIAMLLAGSAFAEVIAGPAAVMDKPYGKVLFTLNDGVKVECGPLENNAYPIGLVVVLNEDAFWGRDRTKKRQPLYGLDGERIGETVRQVTLPLGKVSRGEGRYAAPLMGYVSRLSIENGSVVERALEPIVDHKVRPLTPRDPRAHLSEFGYRRMARKDAFDAYVYRENWMEHPEPGPRVTLIFHKNELAAIAYSRDLHFFAWNATVTPGGHKLVFVERTDKSVAAELAKNLASLVSPAAAP